MATALEDAAAFANHPEARGPVTAAMVSAAVQIANEDPQADNHAQRAQLAWRVASAPDQLVGPFMWLVATNGTLVTKWVDGDRAGAISDLPFVIASVWDTLAVRPAGA